MNALTKVVSERSLLEFLVDRGDSLSIQAGKINITPKSNIEVCSRWLSLHELDFVSEISRSLGVLALQYEGYQTGKFYGGRAPGVCLSFREINTSESFYAIFNASLVRERSSAKGRQGDPLPPGHFSPYPTGAFMGFWQRTGLKVPRSRTSFHDYMGNLRPLFFTATLGNAPERLDKSAICPLEVAESAITKLRLKKDSPDGCRITPGQIPDNFRISFPDKQSKETQLVRGTQELPIKGEFHRGLRLKGSGVVREIATVPRPIDIRPEDQTCEEWLEDYGDVDHQMQAESRIIK